MKVLVFAPHPDDEIIGAGGTIAKRATDGDSVYVCVVTKGMPPLFDEKGVLEFQEKTKEADKYLGVKETFFLDFPAVMLESVPRYELNDSLLRMIKQTEPDEVYIPHRGDMQLDHKMVTDAAMVALRPKYEHKVRRIYAYETLSETGWDIPNAINEFIPNVYEDITNDQIKKYEAMSMLGSQLQQFPNARSIEAMKALAQYRGATVGFFAAEAFMLIREIKE